MAAMSEETMCEVIKSCAYGYTVNELAEKFVKDHASEITETKEHLKQEGYIE